MRIKRILLIVCTCICLLSMVCVVRAQEDKETYRVEKIDGKYVMYFTQPYDESWRTKEREVPRFSSAAEMKQAVFTGQLTSEQVRYLRYKKSTDGKVLELYNMDHVYDVVGPPGAKFIHMEFTGGAYSALYEVDGFEDTLFVGVINKERYDQKLEEITGFTKYQIKTHIEELKDRNGTVTYWRTDVGEFKSVDYVIEDSDKRMVVREDYELDIYADRNFVALDVPDLHFCGEQNGIYFYGSLFHQGAWKKLSYEAISAIGLKIEKPSLTTYLIENYYWIIPAAICATVVLVVSGSLLVVRARRKRKMSAQVSPDAIFNSAASHEDT